MFSSGSWARRYDDANSFAHEENKGGKIGRRMVLKEMDSPTIESTAKQHSESMFRSSNNNQDEKSARILALLRSKDEALMQAQAKYEQERKKTSELRAELDKQKESLTEADEKLQNVQEKFQEHRRAAARDKESDAQKIRHLEAKVQDVEKEKFEAVSKATELEGVQKELKGRLDSTLELQEQVSTLTSALEAADELIGDLQGAVSQARETSGIKDQEIAVLRGQIMSLIGEDGHGPSPSNGVKAAWVRMKADEDLSKPSAAENDGAADVEPLQERIQDLECQLEAANDMKLSVEERCNELESLLHEEQSALKETQNQLELLQQQVQVSKRSKESEVEGLMRECSTLKDHLLEAQQENDTLKSTVWDLERRLAKQTATLVALEAANSLQSQWRLANFQGDSRFEIDAKHNPASLSELSNQIQTMALNTIDLQRQLEDAEAKIVINHRQMEHLHKSLERYRVIASGMTSDQVSSSLLVDRCNENRRGVDEVEELHEMVHNLRERLVHSAAAQEGQAKAFTALVKELAERESILQRKLQDASTVHQHLKSLQSLCSKTIGMMHGTMGQVALEEGNEDQANAILQASTQWSMLGETTSELLRKFQALSEKLNEARLRGTKDAGKTVSETSAVPGHMTVEAVFMDQLDSILHLVAEIRDFFPSKETKRSQQHEFTHASIAAFVVERAQLILEMAETMKSSMRALRKHYSCKQLVNHGAAGVVTQVLSGGTRDPQQDTIEDLVQQIAALNERVSLVSAAHEAALEEASHYQEALEHLKEVQSKFESREEEWKLEIENLKSQLQGIESAASSENRTTTSSSNTANGARDKVDKVANIKDADDLMALLDGLDGLLADAARMEERLLTLEASLAAAERLEKENQVTSNYSRLVSSAMRAKQVAAVWKEWQEELNAVHKIVSHKDRLLQDLEAEKITLLDQVKALQSQQESQQQRHVQEIAAAEAKATQDRQKLHAELTEAVAASTASAVEQRLIAQFEQSMSILKKGLEAARVQCAELRSQKDKIYAEFVRYKEIKQAEIGLLEERLGILGEVDSSQENLRFCTDDERTTSLENEIARACNSDAVSAALREANLERMHRRKVEEKLRIAMISKEESKVQRHVGLSEDAVKVSDIFDSKNMLSFR